MHNIRTADELKAICSRVSEEFRSKRRVLSFAEYLDLFVTDPGRHSRDAAAYVRGAFDHYGHKEVERPWGKSTCYNLFDLPWLDRAKNKSIRYRGLASKLLLGMFFVVFLVLMWLGLQPADPVYVLMARICIPLYFAFFILLPFVSKADGNGPVPERVTYHAH